MDMETILLLRELLQIRGKRMLILRKNNISKKELTDNTH